MISGGDIIMSSNQVGIDVAVTDSMTIAIKYFMHALFVHINSHNSDCLSSI